MIRVAALLVLVVCIYACYTPRYVHSPSAHNVPLFEKKGESKLGLYYSSVIGNRNSEGSRVDINRSSGMDIQLAYAINSKLFIHGSWYHRKEVNDGDYSYINLDSSVIRYNRDLIEIGAGYSLKKRTASKFGFQLSSGFAAGRYEFSDRGIDQQNTSFSRNFRTNVLKIHLQPAMIYSMRSWLTNIISSRFSLLSFNKVKSDYSATELNNFKLDSISYKPVIFWEPGIINTFSFKKIPGIKLEIQAGLSLLSSRNFVDTRPFNLSAGIIADPAKLFRNKNNRGKTKD